MSIQAGMRTPPVPVTIRSSSSSAVRATAGAGVATKKAMRASARNGTRSQSVKRMTKGSLRASDSVWPAAKSDGRNHPSVITAGMAPITTLGAPRCAANAGRMVDCEAKANPTRNSAKSAPSATALCRTLRRASAASSATRIDEDTGMPL